MRAGGDEIIKGSAVILMWNGCGGSNMCLRGCGKSRLHHGTETASQEPMC